MQNTETVWYNSIECDITSGSFEVNLSLFFKRVSIFFKAYVVEAQRYFEMNLTVFVSQAKTKLNPVTLNDFCPETYNLPPPAQFYC